MHYFLLVLVLVVAGVGIWWFTRPKSTPVVPPVIKPPVVKPPVVTPPVSNTTNTVVKS